ncbi:MAG: LPS assembly protein LptD [Gammaproteobacteria bacterium]|nr:LPS assembly protein LptD [Gammaproteobacteria bacterium]
MPLCIPTKKWALIDEHFQRLKAKHILLFAVILSIPLQSCFSFAKDLYPLVVCVAENGDNEWNCSRGANSNSNSNSGQLGRSSQTIRAKSIQEPSTLKTELTIGRTEWVNLREMTVTELEMHDPACCGAFIDRSGVTKSAANNPSQAATSFTTTDGLIQRSKTTVELLGEVTVKQGYRTIINLDKNASTIINQESETVTLIGDISIREPGLLMRGTSANVDSKTQTNSVRNATYVMHETGAHGRADQIQYERDLSLITLDNAEFSRCEPEESFWSIHAETLTLNERLGQGAATAMSLRIKEIPIFYFPYTLKFPINETRMSGFLPATIGSTRNNGTDIEIPYYLNLAPQLDATLNPRFISDRGAMLGTEVRYLSESSMNTLNVSFLDQDKLLQQEGSAEKRWFVGLEHSGQLGPFSSFIDFNSVSDRNYFYDFSNSGLNTASETNLNQQASLALNGDWGDAGLNFQRFQIIDPFVSNLDINKPYDRLPQLTFKLKSNQTSGFKASMETEFTMFGRKLNESMLSLEQIEAGALVSGSRLTAEPEVAWSREKPGSFLRAKARYLFKNYDLNRQAKHTQKTESFGIPLYSLDAGLVFERSTHPEFTQTIEPRVYYLYSGYQDQRHLPLFDTSELSFSFPQLFRDERFSGGDRVSDSNQLTTAITSRVIDAKGREKARVSLGRIEYFKERKVDLENPLGNWVPRYSLKNNSSAIAGEFSLIFKSNWKFRSEFQWNETLRGFDEARASLRYQDQGQRVLNINHRVRTFFDPKKIGAVLDPAWASLSQRLGPRIEQSDLSMAWPLSPKWKILGRWNYDHSNSRNLERFAGIEYSNCCSIIRLVAREWVDENALLIPNLKPNNGIFVQVTLNGLGDLTGGGLNNLLLQGIPGFDDQRQR